MSEKSVEDVLGDKYPRDFEPVEAREARILREFGADLEAFDQATRRRTERPPHVYSIQLRGPVRDQQDWMMIVKAVGENGPEISFHSGRTILAAITSWPHRRNAGKLRWQEDEYPPRNYDEIEAWVLADLRHFDRNIHTPAQGSTSHDNTTSTKA